MSCTASRPGQVKPRRVDFSQVCVAGQLEANLCICLPQAGVAVHCRVLLPELHIWHSQLLLSSPWSQIHWVAPHGGAGWYQVYLYVVAGWIPMAKPWPPQQWLGQTSTASLLCYIVMQM